MGTNTTQPSMGDNQTLITVTKTFLPPIEEYTSILNSSWEAQWITNRGKLVCELEEKLKSHLGVSNLIFTTNGTLPIQIAIKALELKGEIITTPFSYVATTSSIVWENCKPVFVDIDPNYLTIDVSKIEDAITSSTSAILATHVFGNPCDVLAIEKIAKKHNLKVIYDAAHCFGVKYLGQSVFNYGDVSTCSFHATKIFHTGEGGAMICNDEILNQKLFYMHNFGHNGPHDFHGAGINAKASELQAAMGLSVLPHIPKIFENRKKTIELYQQLLEGLPINTMKLRENTEWNFSYFPVLFETEEILLKILENLNEIGVLPRRYFYPSLNNVNYVASDAMPHSESIASRVVCLPLYYGLKPEIVEQIVKVIKENV